MRYNYGSTGEERVSFSILYVHTIFSDTVISSQLGIVVFNVICHYGP